MLSGNPSGGAAMISQVRDLATSDVAMVRPLLGLSASASPEQATAIGTGLAQAAAACVRTDPAAAQAIIAAIVQANDPRVETAYRAIAGDLQTFAVGAGGGGGGGGLGGSGVLGSLGGGGGGRLGVGNGSSIFPNAGLSFSTGGSSVTLGNTTSLTGQVSPF